MEKAKFRNKLGNISLCQQNGIVSTTVEMYSRSTVKSFLLKKMYLEYNFIVIKSLNCAALQYLNAFFIISKLGDLFVGNQDMRVEC